CRNRSAAVARGRTAGAGASPPHVSTKPQLENSATLKANGAKLARAHPSMQTETTACRIELRILASASHVISQNDRLGDALFGHWLRPKEPDGAAVKPTVTDGQLPRNASL